MMQPASWGDLEVVELRLGVGPSVGLDVSDDDVDAARGAATTLVEHREGLADARRCAQVDAQLTPCHAISLPEGRARPPRG